MTEEKAQDTLKVGIEELLEREGKSRVELFVMTKICFPENRDIKDATAWINSAGNLYIQDVSMSPKTAIEFAEWLQDNFLPKGKKDEQNSKDS